MCLQQKKIDRTFDAIIHNVISPSYLLSELVFTGHSDGMASGWSVQLERSNDSSLCPTGSHCISDGKQDTGSQEQRRLSYSLTDRSLSLLHALVSSVWPRMQIVVDSDPTQGKECVLGVVDLLAEPLPFYLVIDTCSHLPKMATLKLYPFFY